MFAHYIGLVLLAHMGQKGWFKKYFIVEYICIVITSTCYLLAYRYEDDFVPLAGLPLIGKYFLLASNADVLKIQ